MFAKAIFALVALSPLTLGQISDGFENGWNKKLWPIYAPDCNQGGNVTLDTTTAHTGHNSMKVVGGSDGYCGHIFFGTTDVPSGSDVYVRTWLKHSTPLSSDHVTFIAMPDAGLGSGEHLRVSGQMEIIEYNRQSDDATMPDLSPDGIASSVGLPTDKWQCLEYHLSTSGEIQTWVNSKAVPGLTYKPGSTHANENGWGTSYKPKIQGVYFGWESYSGTTDTFWYDDIAIASSRIGCAVSSSSSDAATSVAASSASPSSTAASSAPASSAPTPSAPASSAPAPTSSSPVSMTSSFLAATSSVPGGQCEVEYVYV